MGSEGGTKGWKLSGITAQQYAQLLHDYAVEVSKDTYVVGITPFTSGPTPDWSNFDMDPISPLLIPLLSQGVPVITQSELTRIAADIYKRSGVALNTGSALYKYWFAQFQNGNYLGEPTESEHDSEDKTLVLQAFAGAYLWCKKSDYVVSSGKLPFA